MQERIVYLDYSRLFVVFLVIFGHMLPGDDHILRPYIYAFHMPFFCLASGILHKFNGTIQYKKYIKSIIYPYFFFNILFLIIHPLMFKLGFNGQWIVPGCTSSDDYMSILTSFISTCIRKQCGFDGPTWFLLIILWCKIGLDSIMKKWQLLVIFFFLFLVIWLLKHNIFYVRQAIQLFPFFFVGFFFKDSINRFMEREEKKMLLFFIFISLTIILTFLNGRVTWLGSSFGQLHFPINVLCSYFNAFIGSFAFLILSTFFKVRKFVTLASYSLVTILCVQNLFIYTYRDVSRFSRTYIIEIIVSIVILFMCILIHFYFKKAMPWIYGK